MNKEDFTKALEELKSISPKRNFKQRYDMIIKLKGLDLKNQGNQLDFFTQTHYSTGKDVKVCALVGGELIEQAKKTMDTTLSSDDFAKYQKDKKAVKKLADEHDYFVAQANLMAKVAGAFGRVLGPKAKMPNPKAGCVVPPTANLTVIKSKLQKTVRIRTGATPVVHTAVGIEGQEEKEIIDNMVTLYGQIMHHLPQEKNNIREVLIKLTMGKPVKVGAKAEEKAAKKGKRKAVVEEFVEEEKPKEEKKEEEKPKEVKEEKKEEPKEE